MAARPPFRGKGWMRDEVFNRQRFATAAGSAWLDGNEQASQKSGRVLFGEDPRAQHVLYGYTTLPPPPPQPKPDQFTTEKELAFSSRALVERRWLKRSVSEGTWLRSDPLHYPNFLRVWPEDYLKRDPPLPKPKINEPPGLPDRSASPLFWADKDVKPTSEQASRLNVDLSLHTHPRFLQTGPKQAFSMSVPSSPASSQRMTRSSASWAWATPKRGLRLSDASTASGSPSPAHTADSP